MLQKHVDITKTSQSVKSPQQVHHTSVKKNRLRVQRFLVRKSACCFADRTLLVSTSHWPHEPDTYQVRPKVKYTTVCRKNRHTAFPTLRCQSQLAVEHTPPPAMEDLRRDVQHKIIIPPCSADDQAFIAWLILNFRYHI